MSALRATFAKPTPLHNAFVGKIIHVKTYWQNDGLLHCVLVLLFSPALQAMHCGRNGYEGLL